MRVLLDENGYVKEWAMPTDDPNVVVLPDGIDVEDIIDQEDAEAVERFYSESASYHIVDGKLEKDEDRLAEILRSRDAAEEKMSQEERIAELEEALALLLSGVTE